MLPDLLPVLLPMVTWVFFGGNRATAKLLVNQPVGGAGVITMKFHAIGDSSPPNTLLKKEGLQLAEATHSSNGINV